MDEGEIKEKYHTLIYNRPLDGARHSANAPGPHSNVGLMRSRRDNYIKFWHVPTTS